MAPLTVLPSMMIVAVLLGGGAFSNFENPKWLEDKLNDIPNPWEAVQDLFGSWASDEFEKKTGVNLSGNLTLQSVIDAIINLPLYVLTVFLQFLLDIVEFLSYNVYNLLVRLNGAIDEAMFNLLLSELIPEAETLGGYESEFGEFIDPDVADSPIWMSWILVKGILVLLFWFFVLKNIKFVLDLWKYVLDLIPFV